MPEPLKIAWSDHVDTRDNVPSVNVTIQGGVLEYKYHQHYQSRPRGQKKAITDFSAKARLQMLKEFHRVDFEHYVLPLFVTLTYPDDHAETTHEERNLHRKIFARHLEKLIGRPVPAAWRLEWQPRKTGKLIGVPCPHWHLLLFRLGYVPYAEINRLWRKTIGEDGYCRTEIRRVDRHGAVNLYMAKYVSKDAIPLSLVYPTYQSKLGRQYGWLRKALIPRYDARRYDAITEAQRLALTRLADETIPWLTGDLESSFTLLGPAAQDGVKILEGMPLTQPTNDLYTTTNKGGIGPASDAR